MAARRETKEEPLNLVPIMNLVTILIPALLMAVKAVTLTNIETKLPAMGQAAPPTQTEVEEKKPLALQIIIGTKGITLNKDSMEFLANGIPEAQKAENPPPLFPCAGGTCFNICNEQDKQQKQSCFNYDFDALTKTLVEIKQTAIQEQRFKESSQNVVLMPEKEVPYIVLIHTMDAARGKDKDRQLFKSETCPDLVIKTKEGKTIGSDDPQYEQLYDKLCYKRGVFSMVSFAGGLN